MGILKYGMLYGVLRVKDWGEGGTSPGPAGAPRSSQTPASGTFRTRSPCTRRRIGCQPARVRSPCGFSNLLSAEPLGMIWCDHEADERWCTTCSDNATEPGADRHAVVAAHAEREAEQGRHPEAEAYDGQPAVAVGPPAPKDRHEHLRGMIRPAPRAQPRNKNCTVLAQIKSQVQAGLIGKSLIQKKNWGPSRAVWAMPCRPDDF